MMVISHIFAQNGESALHHAAANGHHETCQLLFEHGASVDAQDKVRDNFHQNYVLCKRKLFA